MERKMKKSKIFRIIFMLSFVPYIVLLSISIYYAINGYDVYTWILPVYKGTIYGWEAFKQTIFLYGISMCIIPVLPTVTIYQVVYIVGMLIKKYRNKTVL